VIEDDPIRGIETERPDTCDRKRPTPSPQTARLDACGRRRPDPRQETRRLDACDRKRSDQASASHSLGKGVVIARDRHAAVESRNQATVAATASRNGVAVQPKVRSNLVLSTTQGRSD
jgi:hypothetical protein